MLEANLPRQSWHLEFSGRSCAQVACGADGITWISTEKQRKSKKGDSGISVWGGASSWQLTGRASALVGINPEGAVEHSLDGMTLVTCPSNGSILAATPRELLKLNNLINPPVRRRSIEGVGTIHVFGERVLMCGNDQFAVLSTDLDELTRFSSPCHLGDLPRGGHDGIYWVDEADIRRCNWNGMVETIGQVPLVKICEEIRHCFPDLHWVGSKGTRHVADEPETMRFSVSPDADDELLFVCNRMPGFTVCCFTRSGELRWIRCLSRGCCGYRVQRVGPGRFAAIASCGGQVFWFDSDGNVTARSVPFLGQGLSGMLVPDLTIAKDGSSFAVRCSSSILAFDPRGTALWELAARNGAKIDFDDNKKRLVVAETLTDQRGAMTTRVSASALDY